MQVCQEMQHSEKWLEVEDMYAFSTIYVWQEEVKLMSYWPLKEYEVIHSSNPPTQRE